MNLFEHQIFDNKQPEALEEKRKKKIMKYFSPQSSKSKQHKKKL